MRCDKYMGDSDATTPQVTCIRGQGHPGACDNIQGDYQVFASGQPPVPVSYVYENPNDADLVLRYAERQLGGMHLTIYLSEYGETIDYGNETKTSMPHVEALELFGRLGWV